MGLIPEVTPSGSYRWTSVDDTRVVHLTAVGVTLRDNAKDLFFMCPSSPSSLRDALDWCAGEWSLGDCIESICTWV